MTYMTIEQFRQIHEDWKQSVPQGQVNDTSTCQSPVPLTLEKLGTLIDMKYHSVTDAMQQLKMQPTALKNFFVDIQEELYNGKHVVNVNIHNHFDGTINTLNINNE